ncbi:ACP synthase [Corallococcus carmarthensis]|uniref:ACP synthase n=1 Tax=Corallococcus carmarthensis TaxID=2316728 RepID=UPI00148B4B57|nr:ACP synthase [Corallococcus carmarthensis]NOK19088.1 ACP synthase [Corallococcus carmarthensis]
MSAHESSWTLRRLHAGELPTQEAHRVREHAEACEACGATLRSFVDAQAAFEAEVPFEGFEAGVERARARQAAREPAARAQWARPLMAVAASVLVLVLARPLLESGGRTDPVPPPVAGNRIKGGAGAELRIGGGVDPQRVANTDAPEALQPGERVRLGYTADAYRFVAALSVDAQGEVTPLYPESGDSLAVEPGAGQHWLPESVEFTGAGAERVVLVLTDAPVSMDALSDAARKAFTAAGRDVTRMAPLDVPGAQTQWILLKP